LNILRLSRLGARWKLAAAPRDAAFMHLLLNILCPCTLTCLHSTTLSANLHSLWPGI